MTRVVAVVGPSGSGKTRLITGLLPVFRAWGLKVGVVKHTHHRRLVVDRPGKDSWRHWRAGASAVALVGPDVLAVSRRVRRLSLSDVVPRMGNGLDVILVEGFRAARVPKIRPPFPRTVAGVRLLASDIVRLMTEVGR